MGGDDFVERVSLAWSLGESFQRPPISPGDGLNFPRLKSTAAGVPRSARTPAVFVFNPFAEGYFAQGKGFTPVKHQALLAQDLANLPQFLCTPQDIVLLAKRPAEGFLEGLEQAGFRRPEFFELIGGRIVAGSSLCRRGIASVRPWAWAPDSLELLAPLLGPDKAQTAAKDWIDRIAPLYSKAWSADFLRKVLARCRDGLSGSSWLCSEQEAGVVVSTPNEALEAVAAIRARGHHRVVVKQAHGLAGHNAIRLWEREVLPVQRQWLARASNHSGQLVVEPWLERELDFSVQLEMGRRGLKLCGYAGLMNDRKGQFLANWAEPDYVRCFPAKVAALLDSQPHISQSLARLYGEILSLLEAELHAVGFIGPVGIDAFVYRTACGDCRLKPVVEINPRYTMGRLTLELMKQACPGSYGLFRLVSRAEARAHGFADLSNYAGSFTARFPLRVAGESARKIRQGALCLNNPAQAQVCLATFEVSPVPDWPSLFYGAKAPNSELPCKDLS